MKRRTLLGLVPALPLVRVRGSAAGLAGATSPHGVTAPRRNWPTSSQWDALARRVDGRLFEVDSPFADCGNGRACDAPLPASTQSLLHPRRCAALTQTLGWVDAWQSTPSAYAVAPARASHVAAAVDFARRHRVRLVVKGGGHSYLGTSNAPDSLLVWTCDMHDIVVHDAFVPQGCVATKHRGRSRRRLAERRLLERRCGPVRPVPARLYVDLAAGGLLDERDARMLVDALFAASGHWTVGLHFNKGLAGAPADVIDEAARTAMNPVAMRSFALAIIAAEGPPGHPDVHGHEPDLVRARSDARHVRDATLALRRAVPDPGSYVAESDYFEIDWGRAFWGEHYARLRAIKSRYDPQRIFSVHHGVGSE